MTDLDKVKLRVQIHKARTRFIRAEGTEKCELRGYILGLEEVLKGRYKTKEA